jgi:hypothetical protein
MTTRSYERVLRAACVLALAALGLMAWSLFDPRVFPVMVAMSIGQVLGTASFAAFGWVVLSDLRRLRRAARDAKGGDSGAPGSLRP